MCRMAPPTEHSHYSGCTSYHYLPPCTSAPNSYHLPRRNCNASYCTICKAACRKASAGVLACRCLFIVLPDAGRLTLDAAVCPTSGHDKYHSRARTWRAGTEPCHLSSRVTHVIAIDLRRKLYCKYTLRRGSARVDFQSAELEGETVKRHEHNTNICRGNVISERRLR